jgi:hypothetical protein
VSTYLQVMNLWLNIIPTTASSSLCDRELSNAVSYMLKTGYYQSLYKVITFLVRVRVLSKEFLLVLIVTIAQIVSIFATYHATRNFAPSDSAQIVG